jgi:hypothetical protein
MAESGHYNIADSFLGMLYLATARHWIKFGPRRLARGGVRRARKDGLARVAT